MTHPTEKHVLSTNERNSFQLDLVKEIDPANQIVSPER